MPLHLLHLLHSLWTQHHQRCSLHLQLTKLLSQMWLSCCHLTTMTGM
jgi:hypothetical protein